MFTKTIITVCAALVLTTAYASAANTQVGPQKQAVQPFTEFEKLWFKMPEGVD
jgi:hypothetical protein